MTVKKGSTAAHQELVSDILIKYGADTRYRLWSNNTGTVFTRGRKISFGLTGSSDIIGLRRCDGKFLAIEIKTGKAVQSKKQKDFQKMIEAFGGIYILARKKKVPELEKMD